MTGEVGDCQLFVTQRRHQQHVDLAEDARHLQRDLAAQPIGLDEIDRRQEARLAKQVGPRVLTCTFSVPSWLVSASSSNAAAPSANRIGISELYGQSGSVTSLQLHLQLSQRLHRGAIDVGGRALFHPLRDVADPEARDRRRRVEVEPARHARRIAGISAVGGAAARASRLRPIVSSGRACRATSRASSRRCAARGRTSGASPVTPQRIAGLTMLPPVSLPIEKPTSAAAVAAPGPALDPDAPSSSSHGFIVWPPNQMSLSASAPSESLAISTAPASIQPRDHRRIRRRHARCGTARRRRS